MKTRKENVDRAIHFMDPDYVPVLYWNRDQNEGDIRVFSLAINRAGVDGVPVNEWGYRLESMNDGTMGHPTHPLISEWEGITAFCTPEISEDERLEKLPAFLESSGDRYRLASYDLSGFTVYTLIRGFENSMIDFLTEPDLSGELLDTIFSFENDLMDVASRAGFHGIHFADDWGTQDGLMIPPELWRSIFKPRYKDQFDHAHELGLDVWFHCCGNIIDIVADLHEIGVDVLNISQPNVVDLNLVRQQLVGKQAFMLPVSYQTTSITGTQVDIYTEAQRLYDVLGSEHGGFIGYVEEYSSMGMSEANYRACGRAWKMLDRQNPAGNV